MSQMRPFKCSLMRTRSKSCKNLSFNKIYLQNSTIKPELESSKQYFVSIIGRATLRKNLSSYDFSFSQVTEVEEREPRESFLKPRPKAEAEKCFPKIPKFFHQAFRDFFKDIMFQVCRMRQLPHQFIFYKISTLPSL